MTGIDHGVVPGESVEFIEFKLTSEISQLKQLNDKTKNNNVFAAVERRLRRVTLMHISLDSIYTSNNKIEFDSYPENIFTGDIDLNGNDEILVSGSGFDGLSILFRSNGGIGEKKIITGTSFSEAILVDLNDDGYPDVLAFNILENSLQLFINNTKGVFRLARSIQYSEKINLLQSRDLNNNGIQRIVGCADRGSCGEASPPRSLREHRVNARPVIPVLALALALGCVSRPEPTAADFQAVVTRVDFDDWLASYALETKREALDKAEKNGSVVIDYDWLGDDGELAIELRTRAYWTRTPRRERRRVSEDAGELSPAAQGRLRVAADP